MGGQTTPPAILSRICFPQSTGLCFAVTAQLAGRAMVAAFADDAHFFAAAQSMIYECWKRRLSRIATSTTKKPALRSMRTICQENHCRVVGAS